jgi:hypothetical protein
MLVLSSCDGHQFQITETPHYQLPLSPITLAFRVKKSYTLNIISLAIFYVRKQMKSSTLLHSRCNRHVAVRVSLRMLDSWRSYLESLADKENEPEAAERHLATSEFCLMNLFHMWKIADSEIIPQPSYWFQSPAYAAPKASRSYDSPFSLSIKPPRRPLFNEAPEAGELYWSRLQSHIIQSSRP